MQVAHSEREGGVARERRPPTPISLSVLTGFLGAGKTTLLNKLLRAPAFAGSLVLVNEFGAIGVDHHLVEAIHGETFLVSAGCICCSVRGDLADTLEQALRARDNKRMEPFTRVLIETTGIAEPGPILQAVLAHPYLRLRFQLAGVITVVDAELGDLTLTRFAEAKRQVALADCICLSKTDRTGGAPPNALIERITTLNDHAPRLDIQAPGFDAEQVVAVLAGASTPNRAPETPRLGLRRSGSFDHTAVLESFCLRQTEPVTMAAVERFRDLLASSFGAGVLRYKGFVAIIDDLSRPLLVHGAQHAMSPAQRLAAWPDDDRATRLVFILDGVSARAVNDLWAASTGQLGPDTADETAFAENPLAFSPAGLLSQA